MKVFEKGARWNEVAAITGSRGSHFRYQVTRALTLALRYPRSTHFIFRPAIAQTPRCLAKNAALIVNLFEIESHLLFERGTRLPSFSKRELSRSSFRREFDVARGSRNLTARSVKFNFHRREYTSLGEVQREISALTKKVTVKVDEANQFAGEYFFLSFSHVSVLSRISWIFLIDEVTSKEKESHDPRRRMIENALLLRPSTKRKIISIEIDQTKN